MTQHSSPSSAALVAAAGALGRVAWGANERVRVAIMGLNGRGWDHVTALHRIPGAEVAALCEPDTQRLEARAAETESLIGVRPRTTADIRELLADPSIDAVVIAAPNHWHAPAALWALEAGKHVYIEKPICHTMEEGYRLVQAAKQRGRVVQHGTQRRSEKHWQAIVREARKGIIGDIYMARCICFQPRPAVNFPREEAIPPFLDWELWQGPATDRAFSRNYVHYNWHWFWHYGNGETGNNIVHFADIAHWVMGKGLPVEVFSEGGRFGYAEDVAETPNVQVMTNRFADGTLLVNEVRNRPSNTEAGVDVGILLYGSEGHMANSRFYNKSGRIISSFRPPNTADATELHVQDFIRAIRENRPDSVAGTAEDGFVAAGLCHLGNISYRLGRKLDFDPALGRFRNAPDADALLTREYRAGFELPARA
jgi:predicted dehydrogenase